MSKLLFLTYTYLLCGSANAQTIYNNAVNTTEMTCKECEIVAPHNPVLTPEEIIKAHSAAISSAARRSTLVNNASIKKDLNLEKSSRRWTSLKSVNQARRVIPHGRPVQINFTVIPVPGIAKPNRMALPSRRLSLPIG